MKGVSFHPFYKARLWVRHFGTIPMVIACDSHQYLFPRDLVMLRLLRLAAVLGGLCLSAAALAKNVDPATYGYPLTNPF